MFFLTDTGKSEFDFFYYLFDHFAIDDLIGDIVNKSIAMQAIFLLGLLLDNRSKLYSAGEKAYANKKKPETSITDTLFKISNEKMLTPGYLPAFLFQISQLECVQTCWQMIDKKMNIQYTNQIYTLWLVTIMCDVCAGGGETMITKSADMSNPSQLAEVLIKQFF